MILASILITSETAAEQKLSDRIQRNIASFVQRHPGIEHRLFLNAEIREFVRDKFGREVVEVYDCLKPFAYKADLARYCIIHHFGGVYADLSYFFLQPCLPESGKISVFRDFFSCTPWDTSNGLFAAPAGHKALARAIDMVCANVGSHTYGQTPLCPTGPVLFGRAVANECEPGEIVAGDARWIVPRPRWYGAGQFWRRLRTSRKPSQNGVIVSDALPGTPIHVALTGDFADPHEARHCLCRDSDIIAVKNKGGGHPLTALGLAGGNSYVDLWYGRNVYGKDNDGSQGSGKVRGTTVESPSIRE